MFTREFAWTAAADRVTYRGFDEYRIDVMWFDGRRASIRRDLPVHSATHAWAADEIGPFSWPPGGPACELTAEAHAEQAGWVDRIPWIKDLKISPDGGLWVLRRAPGETLEERIDVFGADGAYVGTLPPGFPFPVAFRGPDEIVALDADALDREYVRVLRISR